MFTLPQLLDEDLQCLNAALSELISQSEASTAVLTDKAGFRLAEHGDIRSFDTTTLAALASGSFLATQAIAQIINEPNFNSVYQQGDRQSMLVCNVDEFTVLIVIFPATVSVGAVKYYALSAIEAIATQLRKAKARSPEEGMDLAMLNIADTPELFKRKDPAP